MNSIDAEYLENCLKHTTKQHNVIHEYDKLWYANGDTLITVARILDKEFNFPTTSEVIDFFESPYKFEKMIEGIIEEFNKERGGEK